MKAASYIPAFLFSYTFTVFLLFPIFLKVYRISTTAAAKDTTSEIGPANSGPTIPSTRGRNRISGTLSIISLSSDNAVENTGCPSA